MKNRAIIVGNIVLLCIALLLGYLIYQQQISSTTGTQEIIPQDFGTYTQESDVLNWPRQSASAEEQQRHADLIGQLAVEAEYVDIADCVGQPTVFHVQIGQTFTIRNQDTVEHSLTIENDSFSVPAGGMRDVIADSEVFKFGPGNYGYVCDSKQGVAGVFFVTP